jgi:hypothetical protein
MFSFMGLVFLFSQAVGADKSTLQSGPQPGEPIGSFFSALHLSGPERGKIQVPYCYLVTKARPSVMVFSRTTSDAVFELIKKLDAETDFSKELTAIVFLSEEEAILDPLKAFLEKQKLREVILTVNSRASQRGTFSSSVPPKWKISDEAEVTVILFDKSRRAVTNFAFRKGELEEKTIYRILTAVAKIHQAAKK